MGSLPIARAFDRPQNKSTLLNGVPQIHAVANDDCGPTAGSTQSISDSVGVKPQTCHHATGKRSMKRFKDTVLSQLLLS